MSNQQVSGKVENAFKNKNGFGSLLVNGNWYGTGKDVLSQFEGAMVEFATTSKVVNGTEYFNVSGDVITTSAAPPAAAAAPAVARPGGRSYADEKQVLIMRQNACSTGANIVSAALASGALALPTAKGKALDAIFKYVDAAAAHVYGFVTEGTGFDPVDDEVDPSLPPTSDFNATEA